MTAIAVTLALILLPTATAHASLSEAKTESSVGTCSGAIDHLCTHIDCNTHVCVKLFCPIYIGHNNHAGGGVGCTPP